MWGGGLGRIGHPLKRIPMLTLSGLRSYLQQRRNRQGPHFTYEIIVVDDGSRDATVRCGHREAASCEHAVR